MRDKKTAPATATPPLSAGIAPLGYPPVIGLCFALSAASRCQSSQASVRTVVRKQLQANLQPGLSSQATAPVPSVQGSKSGRA